VDFKSFKDLPLPKAEVNLLSKQDLLANRTLP
jgi:hypothetical protein